MVTGDSQEEVIIFRDRQTDRHFIIIYISASSPASSPSSSIALRMIIETWRSYFISQQIFENKV